MLPHVKKKAILNSHVSGQYLAEMRKRPHPDKHDLDRVQPDGSVFCGILWCPRRDSNPHTLRHMDLNHARLPIPPRGH